MALDFNKFAIKGNSFIKDLAKELGYPEDTARAGRVLKSVLHALRNHITIEESVQMLAQLPMFLKAVYVDGWSIHKKHKKVKHMNDFISEIKRIDKLTLSADFPVDQDIESALPVIFMVLRRYVSLGELEDIKGILPKELKPMLNTVLMV